MSDVFETLHAARLRGMAPVEALGDGVDALVAEGLLLVTPRGALLTPAGLERHGELLAAAREGVDQDALAGHYERFLGVNQKVKDACSDWQAGDQGEQALVETVDRLGKIADRVRPALEGSGEVVPRFTAYAERLDAALDAATAGDARFITSPAVDSFHTAWFECHEDFLLTLGRSREEEGSF